MNNFTKPKMHPPGTKGAGVLFVDMYGPDDPRWGKPPTGVWRVVDYNWKFVPLESSDGTLEPPPMNPPTAMSKTGTVKEEKTTATDGK